MRHRWGQRKLGRKTEHRISLLRNMASQLIVEERLETTLEKAKELRSYVEKLITTAREDSVAHRRLVTARLHNYRLSHDKKNRDDVVKVLFNEVAPRFVDRPGGYTRILKTDVRRGDAAQMAIIELVARRKQEAVAAPPDAEKPTESKASSAAGRLTRRLLGGAKKSEATADKPAKKAAGKKKDTQKAAPKPEKTSKKTTKGAPKKAAKKSSKGQ